VQLTDDHIVFDAASVLTEIDASDAARQPGVFLGRETKVAAIDAPTGSMLNALDEPAVAAEPAPEVFHAIFAAASPGLNVSKKEFAKPTTAAGAPTSDTLNEPEQRAPTTGPHPHAFVTEIAYAVGSCAKVGPLARTRIEDEVFYAKFTRAAFGPILIRRAD
jgi:hypothetical protein